MTTAYTPGPWKLSANHYGGQYAIWGEGNKPARIASVAGPDEPMSDPEGCAGNAALIAAAPDLLEALQDLLEALQFVDAAYGTLQSGAMDIARAAIAKATGCTS